MLYYKINLTDTDIFLSLCVCFEIVLRSVAQYCCNADTVKFTSDTKILILILLILVCYKQFQKYFHY